MDRNSSFYRSLAHWLVVIVLVGLALFAGAPAPVFSAVEASAHILGAPRSAAWVNGSSQPALQAFLPIADRLHQTELGIQNASASAAMVNVGFYDSDGSVVYTAVATLPPLGSQVIPVSTFTDIPADATISAVVNADQPVVATALLRKAGSEALFGYGGFANGGTWLNLPLIRRAYFSTQTAFWVQNTGGALATVTMTYTPFSVGNTYVVSDTIPAGAAHLYDQVNMLELGTSFAGFVTVQSDAPLAAVVVLTNSTNASSAAAYSGLPLSGAATSHVYPYQRRFSGGAISGVQVLNLGAASASVTGQWYAADGSAVLTQNAALAAGSAYTFYLGAMGVPDGFDGSVILSSDQPISVYVQEDTTSLSDAYTAELALDLPGLATSLYLPQVVRNLWLGLDTDFSIQNPNGAPAALTVNFYAQDGSLTTSLSDALPAHGVKRYSTEGLAALGDDWSGALVVTADQPLALVGMHWLETLPPAELLAHWALDGNLSDASGHGYDLAQVGDNLYSLPGCLGQALHFNNDASAYLTRGGDDPAFDFGSASFSVELWLNFDRLPSESNEQTLIEKCSGPGCGETGWGITVLPDNRIRFIQNVGWHTFIDSSPIAWQVGRWHHLAVVRRAGSASIYVDGLQVGSGPAENLADTAFPLILGRRFDDNQQFPLIGFLDDVSIYTGGLEPQEVWEHYQAGASCQAGALPLRVFIYDDYEEQDHSNSLRQYLEARGHSVTYSHDNVGLIDVWQNFANYDVILVIHSVGSGTLTNLQTWFQNGRGYVAMLGGGTWNDPQDDYILGLIGGNENAGEGWSPNQLYWADPGHPIANDPHTAWQISRLPWGQNHFYLAIPGAHTVVGGPSGAVLQTLEGVEGAGRLAVFGSNYHGEDRSDIEARYLVENLLTWAADMQPTAWFQPDTSQLFGAPSAVLTHTFTLVNRTGGETSFDLSLSGNAWPSALLDVNGDPIATTGLLPNGGRVDLRLRVQVPAGLQTGEKDTVTLSATDANNPALVATAQATTSGPGPAASLRLWPAEPSIPNAGTTVLTAQVLDEHSLPVLDGTQVAFSANNAAGGLSPLTALTVGGVATTTLTGLADCALADLEAASGLSWDRTFVSVGTSGPTDIEASLLLTDTAWTACGSPYLLHGDVHVAPGVTLTIEPGAQLRFDGDTGLYILGALQAVGQSQAHLCFTANSPDPSPAHWKGLVFGDQSQPGSGQLQYAALTYAGAWQSWGDGDYGAGALVYHGSVDLNNDWFAHNQNNGFWAASQGQFSLTQSEFNANSGGAHIHTATLAVADQVIEPGWRDGAAWRYSYSYGNPSEPPTGWNTDPGFDDSVWATGYTPFCDSPDCRTFQELEGGAMYARRVVTPAYPGATQYYLRGLRDDLLAVWVNGTLVFSDTQGGGGQWTPYLPVELAPGPNLVAARMWDAGRGGNVFDLELVGGDWQQPVFEGNRVWDNGRDGWAGVFIWDASPLVSHNEIWANQADGLTVQGAAFPLIQNNLVHHNGNDGLRFGFDNKGGGPQIVNNTFDSNGRYGLYWQNDWTDQPVILNNLMTHNGQAGVSCAFTRYEVFDYNLAWGNPVNFEGCPGEGNPGNLWRDPLYVDGGTGDYHLGLGSPAIDAGDPDPAYNDVDATRNDLGAYGGPGGESYAYVDLRGPIVEWAKAIPPQSPPGETVTLNAWIRDPNGVFSPQAEIEAPDESVLSTLDLHDDGAHGDGAPGDGVYGAQWTTPLTEQTFLVDIQAVDGLAQTSLYDNVTSFATRQPVTLVVTSAADNGPGTLRQALLDALYGDTITFDPAVFPQPAPEWAWDNYVVHTSHVLHEGGEYKMWYAGFGTGSWWPGAIGYATSPDGLSWSKHPGGPVLTGSPGAWDAQGVEQPFVFHAGAEYRLWYTGREGPGGASQIGHASSPDGLHWTKTNGPVLSPGSPGEWDEAGVGAPFILWTGDHYTLWYQGTDASGLTQIGLATSPDGLDWTKHPSNPVFTSGLPGAWDSGSVNDPNLVWDGSQYHLFYAGRSGGVFGHQIGHATSPDGYNWTRDPHNPVLQPGAEGAWDDGLVSEPNVVLDGSTYRMWFSGYDGAERWNRGYASSSDATNWSKEPANPVLVSSPPGSFILPTSGQLPDLSAGHVTIDASNAGVVLDGSAFSGDEDGLGITSEGNLVKGLQIYFFPGDGIEIQASGNTIGGATAAERNVLAGNGQNGLRLSGAGADDNTISGNYIGARADGLTPLPNRESGLALGDGASGNLIGGTPASPFSADPPANLIFANRGSGLNLWGYGTQNNTIQGNWIGRGLADPPQAFPGDMALSPAYASDCTLYVATVSNGLHKSTDCGSTWTQVNNGLHSTTLWQVEFAPGAVDADTLYVADWDGRLYVSHDAAASWSLVSNALQGIDRRNLVFSADFANDQTLYASAENWSWWELGNGPGVFKSTDGGLSWQRRVNGMGDDHIRKVIASPDPAEKNTLFAFSWGSLYKSTDGAASWSQLPLPDNDINDLALSPAYANDQTVFVATNHGWLYRSGDGGATWQAIPALRGDPRYLAFSPAYPNDATICHGGGWNDWLYCSNDGGVTWWQSETGLRGHLNDNSGTGVLFSPAFPTDPTVFVLSIGGISRSDSAGTSFQVQRSLTSLGNTDAIWLGGGASHNAILDNLISNNMFGVSINDPDTSYNTVAHNRFGVDPSGSYALSNVDMSIGIHGGHNNLIDRNLVSGSRSGEAIRLNGNQVLYNSITGNFVGTDASGTAIIGNSGSGIGLQNGASYNTIGGASPAERNLLSGNRAGVQMWDEGTRFNLVTGNTIGLDVTGTQALPNRDQGVELSNRANENSITGNVISGNTGVGVNIHDEGTNNNLISGNLIGLDSSGTYAIPNSREGVQISNWASGNRIGGPSAAERNVISGNGVDCGCAGVWIGDNAHHNTVQGNYIGSDASGSRGIGNQGQGIDFWSWGSDNQVLDNLISANGGNGISFQNNSNHNLVAGNLIGTTADGSEPLLNGWQVENRPASAAASAPMLEPAACEPDPALLSEAASAAAHLAALQAAALACQEAALVNPGSAPQGGSSAEASPSESRLESNTNSGVYISWTSSDNTIGPGNTIAFNDQFGVQVQGNDSLRNTITQNSLFRNARAGIALQDGGNADLPAPRLEQYDLAAGSASGTACAGCTVEVFSASDDEGRVYEGSALADGSGQWSLVAGHAFSGPYLTATATDPAGNTSPFSQLYSILVYDLNIWQTSEALAHLGLQYTLVDAAGFATVDLNQFDVFLVGFTGNDPQPPDLLQPLLDRQADIAAFVQNGGGLVVNSEDGVVRTDLDWLWLPVSVTHQNAGGQQLLIAEPTHPLAQGLAEAKLQGWWPYHNTFSAWDWPEAQVVFSEPRHGAAVILAGGFGAGRMVLSGSDPDYHFGDWGADLLFANELAWAAGKLADTSPVVTWQWPAPGLVAALQPDIEFTFNERIDPASFNAGTVSVVGSLSGPAAGALSYLDRLPEGRFTPATPFITGEQVLVTLSGDITDLAGNGLDGDGDGLAEGSPEDDYTWSFSVRAGETWVVNDPGDAGGAKGLTLRQALQQAQTGDTITFDPLVFPPASPVRIYVENEPLPELGQGYLTIDASNAGVVLDGSRLGWGSGLFITSDGNRIRGLQIHSFPDAGIWLNWASGNIIGGVNATPGGPCSGECNLLSGDKWGVFITGWYASGNIVSGNYLGTDLSGTAAFPNHENGILLENGAQFNTIGGLTPAERNLISGNNSIGLFVDMADYNTVIGNYIGVDASGLVKLGNTRGVQFSNSAHHNRLGGGSAAERNLVSGGRASGVFLSWDSYANTVQGNYIGLGADGLTPLGNSSFGVVLWYGSFQNTFGGLEPGQGNLISDNAGAGIGGGGASDSQILGNWIGLGADGLTPLGNHYSGVYFQDSGGLLLEANRIAHSDGNGIEFSGDAHGNTFRRNSLHDNLNLGIDLLSGANENIVAPVVTAYNPSAGTAQGTACPGCTVEVFSDAADEGRWYEGTTVADGAGAWAFNKGAAFSGAQVHTTATDDHGNTSEFSGPAPELYSVNPAEALPGTVDLGVTISGANFRDNAPLGADFGAGISVNSVVFLSNEQVKAYIDVAPEAEYGPRAVTVTNYDGQSGLLPGAFTVVSQPPPPPTATLVSPDELAPGVSGDIWVLGLGFIDRPRVTISGSGVTVNWVSFDDPTRLHLNVSVDPAAPLGLRDLTLTNPDGQSTFLPSALALVEPYFSDVAPALGLDVTSGENGAAWGDLDGDGWLDLALGDGRLFTSTLGAAFSDASAAAGLDSTPGYGGLAWGDYNNDGRLDLLSSWQKIYRQGSLPFIKVFDGGANASTLAWVDYDTDGDLDAYASGRLFRNDGADQFSDMTEAAGLDSSGWLLSSAWADYDDDGDPDLYLTNVSGPNRLYRNNGDGSFTDVSAAAGVDAWASSHGAAWGDYDNDGDFDLFVAMNDGQVSRLYRNNGNGSFSEVGAAAGMWQGGNATGANWLDYNLDGWLDLYVVGRDAENRLYRNNGNGTFTDYRLASGANDPRDSDGSTVGDFDNDGDPDIYVVSGIWGGGTPNFLFRNNLEPAAANRHWLKVRLVGVLSNYTGLGARVRLFGGGPLQTRQLAGSNGYLSQEAPEALFGLGSYAGTVGLEVTWPSGVVQTLSAVAVDQAIELVEPTPYLHDFQMVGISPVGERPIDIPIAPLSTLRNLGQFSEQSVPLTCRITFGGNLVYEQTLPTDAVPPSAWESLLFPAFTPTETGSYSLTCQSFLPGDERPENDSLTTQIVVTQQVADAWTQDNPNDDGDVPSGLNNWYGSPDLWVRNADDGGLIHQDPIQGVTNTVYVRLRNRGNIPVETGSVSVYWIEPSLGVRCGGWAPIGEISFTNLQPGEERIVKLPWVPTRSGHTCLQDVIDSPQDPYDRGLECSPLWVPWDNNVEWHNVNILANPGSQFGEKDIKEAEVQLVNVYDRTKDVDVVIDRLTFPLTGTISVFLPGDLFERWLHYSGRWSEGLQVLTDTQEIQITGPISGTIGGVPMFADEQATVGLHFSGPAGLEFDMAIRERIDGVTMGGVAYHWMIPDSTPPLVAGTTPAAGATRVALDQPLVIRFNEPVSPLTFQLNLAPDPGGWSSQWSADGAVVTATHAAFAEGTLYSAQVSASDIAGNAMVAPHVWSFTSRTFDTLAPQVLAVSPANAAGQVDLSEPLVITFSEPISAASLELSLLPDPGGWAYDWNTEGSVVTATHAAFAGDTLHAAQVNATDLAGNPLAAPYQWSFTTRLLDQTAPAVLSVTPVDGATKVDLLVEVVITFSEAIDPSSFNLAAGPDPGGWSYSWSADGQTVTASHNPFAEHTTYQITLQAADLAGNPLAAPYQWSFTTIQLTYPVYLPVVMKD